MRWASSSTTTSKWTSVVGDEVGVARQQLVVDELERAVATRTTGACACRVSPPITSKGRSSAHSCSSRVQLTTSGFGQTTSARRISPRVEQQPQRDDDLHRLAQPHLVGEQRRVARHQEGDALDLIRDTAGTAARTCLPANRSSSGGCSRYSSRSLNITMSLGGLTRVFGLRLRVRRFDLSGCVGSGAASGVLVRRREAPALRRDLDRQLAERAHPRRRGRAAGRRARWRARLAARTRGACGRRRLDKRSIVSMSSWSMTSPVGYLQE